MPYPRFVHPGLIILGIILDLGGGPDHDRIGFRYWKNPGPFVQYDGIAGAKGRFLGFSKVFSQAAFSYVGTEIVAVSSSSQCAGLISWRVAPPDVRGFNENSRLPRVKRRTQDATCPGPSGACTSAFWLSISAAFSSLACSYLRLILALLWGAGRQQRRRSSSPSNVLASRHSLVYV